MGHPQLATRLWAIRTASARGRSMTARSWDTQSIHRRSIVASSRLCPGRSYAVSALHFRVEYVAGDRGQRNRRCVKVIVTECCLVCCRIVLFRTWWYHLTFSSRRRQLMSKAFNRLQSRMARFHVSEPYSNTYRGDQSTVHSYIFSVGRCSGVSIAH